MSRFNKRRQLGDLPPDIRGAMEQGETVLAPREDLFHIARSGQPSPRKPVPIVSGNAPLEALLKQLIIEIRFQNQSLHFNASPWNVGGAPISVLPYNSDRQYLLIQNKSTTQTLYVNFDTRTSTRDLEIAIGGNYEPYRAPKNSIYVSASGTASIVVIEGVLK